MDAGLLSGLLFGELDLPASQVISLQAKGAVVAARDGDAGARQLGDMGADFVEDEAVVRGEYQTPAKAAEKLCQRSSGGQVEVIGRLVEKQQLRVCGQGERQA